MATLVSCDKCGNEKRFRITLDSRGVASIFCAECGSFIKKASTADVINIYEAKLAEKADLDHSEGTDNKEKPLCPYCTENYFLRYGRLGTTYTPVDAKYCPMCGRELKPEDRAY